MANPIYLLSKKLKQHPWLKTEANRTLVMILLFMGTILLLNIVGYYRTNAIRSDCLAQGGTLIYKKQVQREISRHGQLYDQEYQTFDRCDLGK